MLINIASIRTYLVLITKYNMYSGYAILFVVMPSNTFTLNMSYTTQSLKPYSVLYVGKSSITCADTDIL